VSTTATASARIDVQPDAAWAWFSLVLGAAAGLTLAAWVSAWLSWPAWVAGPAMVTLTIAGATLGWRTLRTPLGILRRHDEAWWWHHAGAPSGRRSNGAAISSGGGTGHADMSTEVGTRGDVIVTVDLGRWMLVRFDPAEAHEDITPHGRSPRRRRRALWLPLSAQAAGGAAWSAWRALLLSRRATLPDRLRRRAMAATRTDR
jgi:hypothetical protein